MITLLVLLAAASPESPCEMFPAGSPSRSECELNVIRKRQAEEQEKKRSTKLGDIGLRTGLEDLCMLERSPGISFLQGALGQQVTGTYVNVSERAVSAATITIELYAHDGQLRDRLRASVFPGRLHPGSAGTFSLRMPNRHDYNPPWDYARCIATGITD